MSTIIIISTNEHGTGTSAKLMETFPKAINVRASLCTIEDIMSLDYSKIIIVEEFDRAMDCVKMYLLNKASENSTIKENEVPFMSQVLDSSDKNPNGLNIVNVPDYVNAYDKYDQYVNNGPRSGILVSENTFVSLMVQVSKESTPDDEIKKMIDDIDDTSGCLIQETSLFMNAIYYRNYFQQGN